MATDDLPLEEDLQEETSRRRSGWIGNVILILLLAGMIAGIWAALDWANKPGVPLPEGAKIDELVVEKSEHRMLAYYHRQLIKEYKISSGLLTGAKRREGDLRTPEGNYRIDSHNDKSGYHLSLHISYPSAQERSRAREAGYDPGKDIMIHGLPNHFGWIGRLHQLHDWTAGCIAVTDPEIEELFRAVQNGTPIEIRP